MGRRHKNEEGDAPRRSLSLASLAIGRETILTVESWRIGEKNKARGEKEEEWGGMYTAVSAPFPAPLSLFLLILPRSNLLPFFTPLFSGCGKWRTCDGQSRADHTFRLRLTTLSSAAVRLEHSSTPPLPFAQRLVLSPATMKRRERFAQRRNPQMHYPSSSDIDIPCSSIGTNEDEQREQNRRLY